MLELKPTKPAARCVSKIFLGNALETRVNITKSWTASCKIFTVLTSDSNWPNAEKSFIDTPSIKSTDPSGYPTWISPKIG